jgi:superfamily I DNA/RNA helicase
VGDDDQAIYGWRGADIENLKKLPTEFPGAQSHKIGAKLPVDRNNLESGQ